MKSNKDEGWCVEELNKYKEWEQMSLFFGNNAPVFRDDYIEYLNIKHPDTEFRIKECMRDGTDVPKNL